MDFAFNFLMDVWHYYLLPGIVVMTATLLTEVLRMPKVSANGHSRWFRAKALGFAFVRMIWRWPILALGAFVAYCKGETLLTMFALRDQREAQRKADILDRKIPICRRWEKRVNAEGVLFLYYMSDYHTAKDAPPEHRLTHLARYVKGEQVAIMRCMDADHPPLAYRMTGGRIEAEFLCEKDTEWLDLCAPSRDADRLVAYNSFVARYNHPV